MEVVCTHMTIWQKYSNFYQWKNTNEHLIIGKIHPLKAKKYNTSQCSPSMHKTEIGHVIFTD
jgi:hypothetical protein